MGQGSRCYFDGFCAPGLSRLNQSVGLGLESYLLPGSLKFLAELISQWV